jgi:hypothetical protein
MKISLLSLQENGNLAKCFKFYRNKHLMDRSKQSEVKMTHHTACIVCLFDVSFLSDPCETE